MIALPNFWRTAPLTGDLPLLYWGVVCLFVYFLSLFCPLQRHTVLEYLGVSSLPPQKHCPAQSCRLCSCSHCFSWTSLMISWGSQRLNLTGKRPWQRHLCCKMEKSNHKIGKGEVHICPCSGYAPKKYEEFPNECNIYFCRRSTKEFCKSAAFPQNRQSISPKYYEK